MASSWRILVMGAVVSAILHPSFSPIQPRSFFPPKPPLLEGPLASNTRLREAQLLFPGQVEGPEDVIGDAEGNLWCSNRDGSIRKLWRNGSVSVWAHVGGQPLGIEWAREGSEMVVCDADKGLLLVKEDGSHSVLTSESEGVPFRLTDNAAVSKDGRVYFSDASSKFGMHNFVFDILEARPHGRLLRFDPSTNSTETLLTDLYFANGVALSQDEDFVLVAESSRYQIQKFYLKGPKAGTSELFMDNLPGFPDNINLGADGLFWIGLFLPRQWTMDFLHGLPMAKAIMARLPPWMWVHFEDGGMVMAVDEEGEVRHFLMDPGGEHLHKVTSARVIGGALVLGSLKGTAIGYLPLEAASEGTASE